MARVVVIGGVWPPRAAWPFLALGSAWVIGGGLLSAAIAGSASYHSSWAVAYIVLVAGVAQVFLGLAQAGVSTGGVRRRVLGLELAAWNLGNAAVLAGTLLDVAAALYLGCALLITTLVLILVVTRHAPRGRVLLATRVIIVLLLISMPIGIVIQGTAH